MAGPQRVTLSFKGGDKYRRVIKAMKGRLDNARAVNVGFLATAEYPAVHGIRGTPRGVRYVAQAAFLNEFGTSRIPARPAFRTMIEQKSPKWGDSLAYLAKAHNYDAKAMLTSMGEGIKDQLRESITQWSEPPNAPRTVAIKGFNKPLKDEGIMEKSVSYEVVNK